MPGIRDEHWFLLGAQKLWSCQCGCCQMGGRELWASQVPRFLLLPSVAAPGAFRRKWAGGGGNLATALGFWTWAGMLVASSSQRSPCDAPKQDLTNQRDLPLSLIPMSVTSCTEHGHATTMPSSRYCCHKCDSQDSDSGLLIAEFGPFLPCCMLSLCKVLSSSERKTFGLFPSEWLWSRSYILQLGTWWQAGLLAAQPHSRVPVV